MTKQAIYGTTTLMSDIFQNDKNSTPLAEEEKQGLKAKWATTRGDINWLETVGIFEAENWLITNKDNILTEKFLKKLHKKMFGKIWDWAGKYRTTEKNLGVPPYQIIEKLKILFDDINYWIENKTFSEKEIAVRLHHRLVQIHPFVNGNGRSSRLMADLLMERVFQLPRLNWGNKCIDRLPAHRSKYMIALRSADRGDYRELIKFLDDSNCTL